MTTKPSFASASPYTLPEVCSLQLPIGWALIIAGYFFFSSKFAGKWMSAEMSQYPLLIFTLSWDAIRSPLDWLYHSTTHEYRLAHDLPAIPILPRHTRLISDLHSRAGCQVAERDCRNRSLWVSLWVRIFASEFNLALDGCRFLVRRAAIPQSF